MTRTPERTANPPVWVVISALDRQEATRLYGPLGTRFLAKPFDPWELVAILKQLLAAKDNPEQSSLPQGNPISHGRKRPGGG